MSTLGKYSSFVCYDLSGILRLIEMDCVSEYAYILHDKDKRLNADTGEIEDKKPHYHLYIHFLNQPSKDSILNILGSCIYQSVKNKRALLRYFLHLDDSDKVQYTKESIVSNFNIDNYLNYQNSADYENDSISKLLDFISSDQYSGIESLIKFAIKSSCYSVLRTNYVLLRDYIKSKKAL